MGDVMVEKVEKVARGLVRFRLDHNGHTYQPGAKERYINTAWRDWQGEARAALSACHFGVLVEALDEAVRVLTFAFEEGALPEETVLQLAIDPHGMLRDARAVLAKVKDEGHG